MSLPLSSSLPLPSPTPLLALARTASAQTEQVLGWVRQTRVEEYATPHDRLMVVQFIIVHYTVLAAQMRTMSEKHVKKLIILQKHDLPLAWNLLLFPSDAKLSGMFVPVHMRVSARFRIDHHD
jgi:hypothetical protein